MYYLKTTRHRQKQKVKKTIKMTADYSEFGKVFYSLRKSWVCVLAVWAESPVFIASKPHSWGSFLLSRHLLSVPVNIRMVSFCFGRCCVCYLAKIHWGTGEIWQEGRTRKEDPRQRGTSHLVASIVPVILQPLWVRDSEISHNSPTQSTHFLRSRAYFRLELENELQEALSLWISPQMALFVFNFKLIKPCDYPGGTILFHWIALFLGNV